MRARERERSMHDREACTAPPLLWLPAMVYSADTHRCGDGVPAFGVAEAGFGLVAAAEEALG